MVNCWKCRAQTKWHPEIKLENWTIKKDYIKVKKKIEITGFDTVTQAQNYLKLINKKLKLWEEQIFRNQVKKN
jgi:hypothetical protein